MHFTFSFKSLFIVLHYLCIKLHNKIFILKWVCFLCSFYGKFASLLFWLPLSVSIVVFYWKSWKHHRRNCIELFKQNGNTKKYICGTLPFTALQVNRNYDDFRCWETRKCKKRSIGHLWSILKWKVEEHNVYNIHQLRDVVMEEWKRTPVATCEALVNSMLKRVKAVSHMKIYLHKYLHKCEGCTQGAICRGGWGRFPPLWFIHPCLCWITFIPGGHKNFRSDVPIYIKWFAIKALKSWSESNDLWYAIRLEHFETVNPFET